MKEPRCPNCGSHMFMVDAEVKERLPVGFGFKGTSDFVVDSIERKGWKGVCLDCRQDGVYWYSKRNITRKPRSINNKIKRGVSKCY